MTEYNVGDIVEWKKENDNVHCGTSRIVKKYKVSGTIEFIIEDYPYPLRESEILRLVQKAS